MMAYRLLFLTIVFLPPATHLPRSRHPHSPYRPQSPPRTAAAHRVLSPAGDQVRIGAPAQTDLTVAFEPPSQPPFRGCCDDHLSPPRLCRALWSGQPVHWDGRWQTTAAVVAPTPARPGGPPLWIGG